MRGCLVAVGVFAPILVKATGRIRRGERGRGSEMKVGQLIGEAFENLSFGAVTIYGWPPAVCGGSSREGGVGGVLGGEGMESVMSRMRRVIKGGTLRDAGAIGDCRLVSYRARARIDMWLIREGLAGARHSSICTAILVGHGCSMHRWVCDGASPHIRFKCGVHGRQCCPVCGGGRCVDEDRLGARVHCQ
jgi:hypothetical protein